MAIEATGVENVMGEVAHFWQLRKFQFIEEATDFWMDAVAPKECFGDEDPEHYGKRSDALGYAEVAYWAYLRTFSYNYCLKSKGDGRRD